MPLVSDRRSHWPDRRDRAAAARGAGGRRRVGDVRGMARRPFDPVAEGGRRPPTGVATSSTAASLAALFDGADVAVHLAFAIFGDREETPADQPRGQPQRLRSGDRGRGEAARLRLLGRRLRLPPREPAAADRGCAGPRQRELLLLGPEGRAGGDPGRPADGDRGGCLRVPALHRRRPAGADADRAVRRAARLGDPLPALRRGSGPSAAAAAGAARPRRPLQLVHHDDVARALAAAIAGKGKPGAYNLAGEGEIGIAEIARALGWRSVPVPGPAVGLGAAAGRAALASLAAAGVGIGAAHPGLMDTSKARRELGWEPRFDAAETLLQTAVSARERAFSSRSASSAPSRGRERSKLRRRSSARRGRRASSTRVRSPM